MLLPTSNYWNIIHGRMPGEVEQDAEGVQIMRVLGKNMAWLLKLVEHGRETVPAPGAGAEGHGALHSLTFWFCATQCCGATPP